MLNSNRSSTTAWTLAGLSILSLVGTLLYYSHPSQQSSTIYPAEPPTPAYTPSVTSNDLASIQQPAASTVPIDSVPHILDRLKLFTVNTSSVEAQAASLKLLQRTFDSLLPHGTASVSLITNFLNNSIDRNYPVVVLNAIDLTPTSAPPHEVRARTPVLAFPPSLRIGLFSVLAEQGGTAVEEFLLSQLSANTKPFETVSCAELLMKLSPGRHSIVTVSAVTERLKLLPSDAMPMHPQSKLERDLILAFLNIHDRGAFARQSVESMIGTKGELDRGLADQITEKLQSTVLPLLTNLYNNERMKSTADRAYVAGLAVDFVGKSDEADKFFKLMIADESLPELARCSLVHSLRGANTFTRRFTTPELDTVKARASLLESITTDSFPAPGHLRYVWTDVLDKFKSEIAKNEKGEP